MRFVICFGHEIIYNLLLLYCTFIFLLADSVRRYWTVDSLFIAMTTSCLEEFYDIRFIWGLKCDLISEYLNMLERSLRLVRLVPCPVCWTKDLFSITPLVAIFLWPTTKKNSPGPLIPWPKPFPISATLSYTAELFWVYWNRISVMNKVSLQNLLSTLEPVWDFDVDFFCMNVILQFCFEILKD